VGEKGKGALPMKGTVTRTHRTEKRGIGAEIGVGGGTGVKKYGQKGC